MTQQDALRVLKKNNRKWLKTKDVAKKIKSGSASDNLRRLHKQGFIRRRNILGQGRKSYEWRFKSK